MRADVYVLSFDAELLLGGLALTTCARSPSTSLIAFGKLFPVLSSNSQQRFMDALSCPDVLFLFLMTSITFTVFGDNDRKEDRMGVIQNV